MGKIFSYSAATLASVALHAAVISLFFIDWEPEEKRYIPQPKPIEAKLVQFKPKEQPKPQPKKTEQKAPPKKAVTPPGPKPQPKPQAKPVKQPEKKPEPKKTENKPKPEPVKKPVNQSIDDLLSAMDKEQEYMEELNDQEAVQSYTQLIKQRVESYWTLPPSARRGMRTTVRIQLVPNGRVVSVVITESSGNSAFDMAVVQAVKLAEEFPELREMEPAMFEKHFRQFIIEFEPENLRL